LRNSRKQKLHQKKHITTILYSNLERETIQRHQVRVINKLRHLHFLQEVRKGAAQTKRTTIISKSKHTSTILSLVTKK